MRSSMTVRGTRRQNLDRALHYVVTPGRLACGRNIKTAADITSDAKTFSEATNRCKVCEAAPIIQQLIEVGLFK